VRGQHQRTSRGAGAEQAGEPVPGRDPGGEFLPQRAGVGLGDGHRVAPSCSTAREIRLVSSPGGCTPRTNRTTTPAMTGTTIHAEGSPRRSAGLDWVNSMRVADAVRPKNATVTSTIRAPAAA